MSSTFTWLDYSEQQQRKMLDVISLFQEKETRDELGISVVRDALADLLFPGISTIQTRARYFFFVPWIYQDLEGKRVSSRDIEQAARKAELDLVQPLLASGDDQVFGTRAGRNLQRLPSSVYWNGLGVWGLRRFPGSQAEYHRQLTQFYRKVDAYEENHRHRCRGPDAGTEGFDAVPHNWHFELPSQPRGFPEQASLSLTEEEAEYLRERILMAANGSYLAFLVSLGIDDIRTDFPWQHQCATEAPPEIWVVLDHARNFSLCLHGAALLYNFMLAEKRTWGERIEEYTFALADWQAEMDRRSVDLSQWDRSHFWAMVYAENRRVAPGAYRFIEGWLELVLTRHNADQLFEDAPARKMIEVRELQLKRGLARLRNPRALEIWGGSAGANRLNFRWPNVQTILRDIDRGLGRE